MCGGILPDEPDEADVIRRETELRPEARIPDGLIPIRLQRILIRVALKDGRKSTGIGTVTSRQHADRLEGRPSLTPRPRLVDDRLNRRVGHDERPIFRIALPTRGCRCRSLEQEDRFSPGFNAK